VAVAVAARGGEGGVSQTSSAPRPSKAELNTLPKPLAENISMANVIVDEGVPALQDRLAKLRGYPVVVNQWASWCPPCRAEIPLFQKAAQQYQGKVAFLGIDMQDSRGRAEDLLSELPMRIRASGIRTPPPSPRWGVARCPRPRRWSTSAAMSSSPGRVSIRTCQR